VLLAFTLARHAMIELDATITATLESYRCDVGAG
jgi:hypothetical protein